MNSKLIEVLEKTYDESLVFAEPVSGNSRNINYMISFANGIKYIVKYISEGARRKRMEKEIALCKTIKEQDDDFPCSVPEPVCVFEEGFIYIQDFIEGKTLNQWPMDCLDEQALANGLLTLIERLRNIRISPELMMTTGYESKSWKEFLKKKLDAFNHKIQRSCVLDMHLLEGIRRFTEDVIEKMDEPRFPFLIHNDLNGDNIIVHVTEQHPMLVSVIDFERALFGDPLKDVSKLVWVFRKRKRLGDLFWKGCTEQFGYDEEDYRTLKGYFCFDILNHFSKYDQLLKRDRWQGYFEEERTILQNMEKDTFVLW